MTYIRRPLAELAPEGHLDGVVVSGALVKGLAGLEGRAVKVQRDGRLRVAHVLHSMKPEGVWNTPSSSSDSSDHDRLIPAPSSLTSSLTVNVGALVLLQHLLGLLLHAGLKLAVGPVEERLLQLTLEQLEEAVRVCVIVDAAAIVPNTAH